jgi:D-sedoheptulose 7-phosphate isomerase
MRLNFYKEQFNTFFDSQIIKEQIEESLVLIENSKRIFLIGNGGSNAISAHMAEDFSKAAQIPALCFSDAALITCYSNDYGYEHAIKEWLKIHFQQDDILIAISSSGKSDNIINSVNYVKGRKGKCITLTGFQKGNPLSNLGDINFHLDVNDYGVVEIFHEVIIHSIIDTLANNR